jgi:aspartyl-tRNA synthetase
MKANIREVYAFPMSGGQEIMTGSPRPVVLRKFLDELGSKVEEIAIVHLARYSEYAS